MTDEEKIINVQFKNEETGEITGTKQIRNNIFIDASKKYSWIRKKYLKFVEKIVNMLISHADGHTEHNVRFKRVHKIVKEWIVHRGLRLCERIIGKHLIHTINDIPVESHNNHQRMWLDSWFRSLRDMWGLMIYQQSMLNKDEKIRENMKKEYPTKEDFAEYMDKKDTKSNHGRKLLAQLYMTEVLEDTADRTMNDCFCMRLCHTMMEFYGVKPDERKRVPQPEEFPIYLSSTEKNKQFFVAFSQIPIWHPKDSKEVKILDLERENNELRLKLEKLKGGIKDESKRIKSD